MKVGKDRRNGEEKTKVRRGQRWGWKAKKHDSNLEAQRGRIPWKSGIFLQATGLSSAQTT